jgi:hypothetical protein
MYSCIVLMISMLNSFEKLLTLFPIAPDAPGLSLKTGLFTTIFGSSSS